jgi:hypothetical protein
MNDLHVDHQLPSPIVDHDCTNAAPPIVEGAIDSAPEVVVVNDGKSLSDVARLGDADQAAVITDIEDAVLHEDGSEHGLDDDGGRGVGHKAGLFL